MLPVSLKTSDTKAAIKARLIYTNKVFGERMVEARELCNLTQVDAARKMGYSGSSGLCKIESGKYTRTIPGWVAPVASEVYDVSTDFLFGISEEWERNCVVSQQRDVAGFLMKHWERQKYAEINAIRVLNNKITVLEVAANDAIRHAKRINDILVKFRELNPDFEDMRMGARLVMAAQDSLDDANKAIAELKRYHCQMKAAKASNVDISNGDIFSYGVDL